MKDGRHGVVFYIYRRIKHYQVMCRDDYQELVPFEDVKKPLMDSGLLFILCMVWVRQKCMTMSVIRVSIDNDHLMVKVIN
ncbi:hypothetical protein [Shimazuella kribbensis]|uniref:hypothetical protein n=1 Tax=Shimazuella kribbensis TaxID=139808 RepID=UPI000406CA7C|nr:hypothetical protein [Shimazuella kribbensis]